MVVDQSTANKSTFARIPVYFLGKNSSYGVNRGPDTKIKFKPPGVSSHARSTHTLEACFIFYAVSLKLLQP